jgi:hypothetical protein
MRVLTAVLIAALVCPGAASAQAGPAALTDAWRSAAQRAGPGAEVHVRLTDGTSFRAIIVRADDKAVLLQPKTRVPVPVQSLSYDAIASLDSNGRGAATGKAIAIGAGAAVAVFLGTMAILVAAD